MTKNFTAAERDAMQAKLAESKTARSRAKKTPEQVRAALAVDPQEWRRELPLVEEWFARLGDRVPAGLREELEQLRTRLA